MKDFGKWQIIRLIDILFLGPFMMILASEIREHVDSWKAEALLFFGFTTIAVNLYFFLLIAGWI
jgi:hypothetical protein